MQIKVWERHPWGDEYMGSCNVTDPGNSLALENAARSIGGSVAPLLVVCGDTVSSFEGLSGYQVTTESLKANGFYFSAGALACQLGEPKDYGCHFGFRSDLEASRAEFNRGYEAALIVAKK